MEFEVVVIKLAIGKRHLKFGMYKINRFEFELLYLENISLTIRESNKYLLKKMTKKFDAIKKDI